ncbi:uncharacterized protein [Drosophila takahashii]|uniref:uncharacterized protein n=1 Tax=Drosophila takahashii TaxID=29030 RepID=UPI003898F230
MSDVPCKSFSAALNAVVRSLLDKDTNGNSIHIPPVAGHVKSALKDLSFSYGIMGSTSESVRKISQNEYEMHIILKFPFELTPIRDDECPGFVMLKANEKTVIVLLIVIEF